MTVDPRPVLLGMCNPYGGDERHALYPAPPGCAGWRLWRMVVARAPECTAAEYRRVFHRMNVLGEQRWAVKRARAAGVLLRPKLAGRGVVVLGGDTLRALLGLSGAQPGEWHSCPDGMTWTALPHPSGRCRWYNDPACRAVAEVLLADLFYAARAALDSRDMSKAGGSDDD